MAGTSAAPSPITTPVEPLGGKEFQSFIRSLFRYKDSSNYPYNKRVFITLCEPVRPKFLYGISDASLNFDVGDFSRSGSLFITPLRTSLTGSFHEEIGNFKTNNLAELSTFEAVGFQHINAISNASTDDTSKVFSFIPSPKLELNQQYINKLGTTNDLEENAQGPFNFASGSYVISLCEDDNPSLMVELAKDSELPDGVGEKEFIVIPENLHPHIKDNLLFYLSKAGVDVSGNATDKLEKDTSKETRPPRLGYLQQLSRNRRRFRPQISEQLSPREQRQRDRRRKRSDRRDDRLERREERRENRQERRTDRREDRQENRQDRRENRQDRRENRQNRRENRRNRRRRR